MFSSTNKKILKKKEGLCWWLIWLSALQLNRYGLSVNQDFIMWFFLVMLFLIINKKNWLSKNFNLIVSLNIRILFAFLTYS